MDFNPSKSLLIAGIAGLGAVLVYLAVTGRYQQVGAALGSFLVIPGNSLTVAGALRSSPATTAGMDTGAAGLGEIKSGGAQASTSAGTTGAGRAP